MKRRRSKLLHKSSSRAVDSEINLDHWNEDKLVALLSQTVDAITVLDVDFRVIKAFRGSGGSWGRASSESIGLNAVELVHPDDYEYMVGVMEQAMADPSESVLFEARIIFRDGDWRWAEGSAKSLLDDPDIGGVVFVFRDRHDRKELEDRAISSELSFRNLVQNSADAIVGSSLDHRILVWNLAAEEMFGYTAEEILGQSLSMLLPEDIRDSHDSLVDGFAQENVDRREMTTGRQMLAIRRNGVRFPIEIGLAKGVFDGSTLLIATVRDITVRRLIEVSAENAHSELQAIMSAIPDAICRLDSAGTILDLMAGSEGGLPLSPDSIGSCIVDVLPPEIGPICQAGIDEALARREITHMEFDIAATETEGQRSFETRHVPLGENEVLAVVRDVTDRVASAEEVRRSSDRVRTLAETSFESLVVVDRDGIIAHMGGPKTTSLGYPAESFKGLHLSAIIDVAHPDDHARVVAEYERISAEPGVRSMIQARFRHHDNSWRWLEVSSRNLFYDESVNGLVVNVRDITSEKSATQDLRTFGERFRFLAESSRESLIIIDESGIITHMGGPSIGPLGNRIASQVGSRFVDLLDLSGPESREQVHEIYSDVASTPRSSASVEAKFRHSDGHWVWLSADLRNLLHESAVAGIVVTVKDVTAQKVAEIELRRMSQRAQFLSESSFDGVVVVDKDNIVIYRGGPPTTALGQNVKDLVGGSVLDLMSRVHPDDHENTRAEHDRVMAEPRSTGSMETRFQHVDGTWRWLSFTLRNLFHEEAIKGLLINIRDVTERKEAEAKLEHQAVHDSLTNLPNRTLLADRLEHALARTGRRGGLVGLLFLDLDRFKNINDTLGHNAGDQLLVGVAERLQLVVRDSDTLARLGGDEFVVLGEDVASIEELFTLAERMLESLGTAIQIDGREFYTTASIGIAAALDGDHDAVTLMRNADAAMYRAKQAGRNRIEAFDHALQVRLEHRIGTETALRGALQRDELEMHYQPIVDLSSGRIVGAEALIRWDHPTRGLVFPDEFIPIAEETDLIRSIGAWVAKRTCEQVTEWQRRFDTNLHLAINISARQLASSDWIKMITDVVAATGIEPRQLCMEITETALIDQPEMAIENLSAVRDMGMEVALDDFGTGYASLAYLRTLPITQIKIDRSFTSGLGIRPNDMVIVRSTIELAHGLGLTVVGEGVETEEQMEHLKEFGCDFAQGYFLGRPQSPSIFESVLPVTDRD